MAQFVPRIQPLRDYCPLAENLLAPKLNLSLRSLTGARYLTTKNEVLKMLTHNAGKTLNVVAKVFSGFGPSGNWDLRAHFSSYPMPRRVTGKKAWKKRGKRPSK